MVFFEGPGSDVVLLGGCSTALMIVFLHRYALWVAWKGYRCLLTNSCLRKIFGGMIYDFLCHQG